MPAPPELPGVPIGIPLAFAAVLGLFIGSFLNVVIWRLPRNAFLADRRSRCPRCSTLIAWYDNLPVLSWILLGGRCRACGGRISVRYPIVELLTGCLFAGLYLRFGFALHTLVYLAFAAALFAASVIDLDYRIIPNEISLPGIPLGLLFALVLPHHPGLGPPPTFLSALLGAICGFGFLWIVALVGRLWYGFEAMGMGDVKLLAMIGAFLGLQALPFVIFVSVVSGALAGILIAVATGGGRRTAFAYGPYIAFGAVLYLFRGPEIVSLYLSHSGWRG